jgi:hypothetical protein
MCVSQIVNMSRIRVKVSTPPIATTRELVLLLMLLMLMLRMLLSLSVGGRGCGVGGGVARWEGGVGLVGGDVVVGG